MRWIPIAFALAGACFLTIAATGLAAWAVGLSLGALAMLIAAATLPRRERSMIMKRLGGALRFTGSFTDSATGERASAASGTFVALRSAARARVEPRVEHSAGAALPGRAGAARAADAMVRSAAPGSFEILTEPGENHLRTHAIEVASPVQIQRQIDRFYQRYQKSFLP